MTNSLLIGFSAESSSDESSSDEDSDSVIDDLPRSNAKREDPGELSDDGDDENGPSISTAVVKTKNEITGASSSVPDFEEVGPDEPLEKVGEVMSIVENVVIVKGDPSTVSERASERALDSDSLLVFDDRKVLGYVSVPTCPFYSF